MRTLTVILLAPVGLAAAAPLRGQVAPLRGQVALVTGASRGIGKGIAVELGRAGATVYVTGRTLRAGGSDLTIEETALAVTAAGGDGRCIQCDHANDDDVKRVFRTLREEQGRLDILVNNAFSTEVARRGSFRDKFWLQGGAMWDGIATVGLRGHYICACEATPLMIDSGGGLMVHISSFGGAAYTFNVAYGVAKAALDRLNRDMHVELRGTGINTISLYPGLVRTEGNLELERSGEWAEASGGLDLALGETPAFSGKAVTALATLEPEAQAARSGTIQVVAELARELGFTEDDGSQPPSIRSLQFLVPNYLVPKLEERDIEVPNWFVSSVPDFLLPWAVFSGGPPPE